VEVIPTYLGAHAVPRDAKSREDYIEEMIIKTLPMVKNENLAEFVDVFVASVAYSVEEADIIYSAAHKLGFKLKATCGNWNTITAENFWRSTHSFQ